MMQESRANDRLSTAEVAATAKQPSPREEANDMTKSPGEEFAAEESRPVVLQEADRVHDQPSSLFASNEAQQFRGRWSDIQAGFVDEPRRAVEQADRLVSEVMQRLAQEFADERSRLEQQWDRGGETNTEELRQSLRRFRSFFDRLLLM
jgi:hypothetical protein